MNETITVSEFGATIRRPYYIIDDGAEMNHEHDNIIVWRPGADVPEPKPPIWEIGQNGIITTTCGTCNGIVELYPHAAELVQQTGIRPMCTDCRRRMPARNANRGR